MKSIDEVQKDIENYLEELRLIKLRTIQGQIPAVDVLRGQQAYLEVLNDIVQHIRIIKDELRVAQIWDDLS